MAKQTLWYLTVGYTPAYAWFDVQPEEIKFAQGGYASPAIDEYDMEIGKDLFDTKEELVAYVTEQLKGEDDGSVTLDNGMKIMFGSDEDDDDGEEEEED